MTNSSKEELLSDLWQEDEATLRETLLQGMIAESRRKRSQRSAIRMTLCTVAMIGCGLWLWAGRQAHRAFAPEAEKKLPAFAEASRRNEAPEPRAGAREPEHPITIRHLSDTELKERLKGFAVAYVGQPGAQSILLLEESVAGRGE